MTAATARHRWPSFVWMAVLAGGCMGEIRDPAAAQPGGSGGGGAGGEPMPADTRMPPATSPDPPVDDLYFYREIQPILGDSCVRCHGGVRELGTPPLNLQSQAKAMSARGGGVTALMLARVMSDDPGKRMPLGGQALSPDKIAKLRRWVEGGAPWPTHWAFQPVADVQPSTVVVTDAGWVRSPIDRFVLRRLEQAGLQPSPEADRATLIRRVSLDLTGLPPTPQEVDDFTGDASATAFEKVVDRLLRSPAFGERWARHWLDQARYADSDGYSIDESRPTAYLWRDWVIDAINRDTPFDQFTIAQIAGDLMPSPAPLATAFNTQTLVNKEGGIDPEEDRTKRVIDRVATVAQTWLGLTLGCSQCHSHPYDPISQKELYRLFAFFNNADEIRPSGGYNDGPIGGEALKERTSGLRDTYLLVRGDFQNPDRSQKLAGGTPGVLHPFTARGPRPDRLDLAHWLVDPANPLTPRVTVNTVWYHLFGQGLVATLDDFGSRASLPTHPELLDWLARDFVGGGWRRKRLIRQIVTSATYRQSSVYRADAAVVDPDNLLLHRQNRVRVEAEIVTDQVLAASGLLAPRVGGPSVFPPIPGELLGLSYAGTQWTTSTGDDSHRRGLYTFHKRTMSYPNLQVFDWPEASAAVTGRRRSNTPLQALITLHDTVFAEAAQAFARRVQVAMPGTVRDRIAWAFRLALARAPTSAETDVFANLYEKTRSDFEANPAEAIQAVGNFMPPAADPSAAAAWVATARMILNLDELLTRE